MGGYGNRALLLCQVHFQSVLYLLQGTLSGLSAVEVALQGFYQHFPDFVIFAGRSVQAFTDFHQFLCRLGREIFNGKFHIAAVHLNGGLRLRVGAVTAGQFLQRRAVDGESAVVVGILNCL